MRLVAGTVTAVLSEAHGVRTLRVSSDSGELPNPAVCYLSLTGACAVGDEVLVNTTAVDLGLGTGSAHFVVARLPPAGEAGAYVLDDPSGGHIMKLRYTPLQRDVLAVEEQASAHHAAMAEAVDIEGMPVVCCGLHSHLPHAAAALKSVRPNARVAYVMTDQAALPMALSDLVDACRRTRLLDVTITAGQAFGGEMEAVNLHSALLAAKHAAKADVALVALGPGIVGTATAFGHGGVAQGEAINAAAALGGRAVAALRLSFADARPRHRGVSHHTLTALARVALAPAAVALPALPREQAEVVEAALADAGVWVRHERVESSFSPGELPDTREVEAKTMGRGARDDPAFFAAAAAAGDVAGRLLGA